MCIRDRRYHESGSTGEPQIIQISSRQGCGGEKIVHGRRSAVKRRGKQQKHGAMDRPCCPLSGMH
eukprot:2492881-Prorocentrum_lima.AAC.1